MITLRTLLGAYPHTRALRRGDVGIPEVYFDFVQVSGRLPFRDFVRNNAFDIGELPLIPLLQLREQERPFWLLPVGLTARFQHGSFYVRADSDLGGPQDLVGRRVGLRSDANTGVAWALGILFDDYGIQKHDLTIVSFEDNHVAEYVPPSFVERAPSGKEMVQMLIDGYLDAIITEADLSREGRVRPLISDPSLAANRWYEKHHVVPVGHIVAFTSRLATNPCVVRKIFELFQRSRAAASEPIDIDLHPLGAEALNGSLSRLISYAFQQGLIKRPLAVEELYSDAR